MISTIAFVILFFGGLAFFGYQIKGIVDNIKLGQDVDRTDNKSERIKTMMLVAFGQKKMFKRIVPAIFHLFIYVAFLFTQIELIEIIIDGVFHYHRFFMPILGGFYTFLISIIEVLSFLALVATFVFLARRNLLKIPRFHKSEMNGWPKLDGNIILYLEFLLVACIFTMNGADEVLHERALSHAAGEGGFGFAITSWLGPIMFDGFGSDTLAIIERIGWWGHLMVVVAFMNYLPISKHFHIFLAFPNVYYSNLMNKGKLSNIEAVTNEVKLMFDPNADPFAAPPAGEESEIKRFGAKDVTDLTWKNLLDSYTCTECGRCTSSCPANQTGKLLSPRKIMMDTRDRLTEVGQNIKKHGKGFDDGKSLLRDYITEEELWACTSCNACTEECPVNIDPLSIIIDLRRFLVMEESKMPNELTVMSTNIENNGAPWQFSQADRLKWADEA